MEEEILTAVAISLLTLSKTFFASMHSSADLNTKNSDSEKDEEVKDDFVVTFNKPLTYEISYEI